MRGIDSIAKAVTPREASCSIPSLSVSGCRKPISTWPSLQPGDLVGARLADLATISASQGLPRVAPASCERIVGEGCSDTGAGLDHDVDSGRDQLGHDVGHERDSPLARRSLLGDAHLHARRTLEAGNGASILNCRGLWRVSPQLSAAIEARDPYSRGHASRVTVFAKAMARAIGLDKERLSVLRLGALLHDVGKLTVPPAILLKRGPLTETEFEQVRDHPAGRRAHAPLARRAPGDPAVGAPPPRALGRRGLPSRPRRKSGFRLEARILTVADSFDAMTSTRPYRPPRQVSDALEELDRCAGSQFDPELVGIFAVAWSEASSTRSSGRTRGDSTRASTRPRASSSSA